MLLTFIEYAWFIPLKDKKDITITNTFLKILKEYNRKSSKIWVDKGSEFYNHGSKKIIYKCIQRILRENLLLLKDLLED